jgi:DNA-binding MarR family transcriptional regulator
VSSPEDSRQPLVAAILRSTADLSSGRSAHVQAVAERLGLAVTDVECLRLLAAEGAMPVGRIGEMTALTTGATTRMVDRLEQAGYVRRLPDPADRRRVIVEPVADRVAVVASSFDPVDAAIRRALDGVPDAGLRDLAGYLHASVVAVRGVTDTARDAQPDSDASTASAAPVAGATAGRLVFVTGAPKVAISGDRSLGAELYRGRFGGAVPSARVRGGVVTIRYPRFAWFDWRTRVGGEFLEASAHWRRDVTELVLNAGLPWRVELRGGVTGVRLDARELRLVAFDLHGGAGSVELVLGRPIGVVPVEIRGGLRDATITRPKGVAVRLSVTGGYRNATLDGVAAWSGGRIESAGAPGAADHFEIEVSGGANNVRVTAA